LGLGLWALKKTNEKITKRECEMGGAQRREKKESGLVERFGEIENEIEIILITHS